MRRWIHRLRAIFTPGALDRDFDCEMESHLAMLTEDGIRRGMSAADASRAARLHFGGATQLRESHRAVRGLPWLDSFFQDVRYALRGVRKNPGFTALAVLTLATGIGVNSAVFTVVDHLMLQPIQAADPNRMMQITRVTRDPLFSYPDYAWYRDSNRSFAGLVLAGEHTFSMSGVAMQSAPGGIATIAGFQFPRVLSGGAEPVSAAVVSSNYFQVLGTGAAMGRTFLAEDDAPGAPPVALASYNFWERRFARDPGLLGRAMTLNGVAVTIAGIAPRDFTGAALTVPDLWVPLAVQARLMPQENVLHSRDWVCCRLYGRLRPGVRSSQAEAEMNALGAALQARYPDTRTQSNRQSARFFLGPASRGGQPGGAGDVAAPLLLLTAVGLVLLIACANVASLLLARSTARRREIAIRLAIGAGRGRLIRQLLTENLVIALMAAAFGILFAWWSLNALLAQIQAALPAAAGGLGLHVEPGHRVLAYTLFLAVASTLAFGLVPALEASRPSLSSGLKGDGAAFGRRLRKSRLRDFMVGAQVMVCLLLLIVACLFARASARALSVDLGFNYRNILSLDVVFPQATPASKIAATRIALAQRLEMLPEIQSVGVASRLPLVHGGMRSFGVSLNGHPLHDSATPESVYVLVTPNYFEMLGIPIVRGRNFAAQESRDSSNFDGSPVIVSEATARRFWPGEDPLGKTLAFGAKDSSGDEDAHSASSLVVGVARDIRSWRLDGLDDSLVYLPVTSAFGGTASGASGRPDGTIALRTRGSEQRAISAIERELQSHFSDLQAVVGNPRTAFTGQRAFLASRAGAIGAGLIGLVGLLMAMAGIYGTVGFEVTQRTQEIGVRMALGAGRASVLGLVLWETMRPVALGLSVGLACGIAISRLLHSLLLGLGVFDPLAFLGAPAFLAAVALLAGYLPARRVTRVDPTIALRCE